MRVRHWPTKRYMMGHSNHFHYLGNMAVVPAVWVLAASAPWTLDAPWLFFLPAHVPIFVDSLLLPALLSASCPLFPLPASAFSLLVPLFYLEAVRATRGHCQGHLKCPYSSLLCMCLNKKKNYLVHVHQIHWIGENPRFIILISSMWEGAVFFIRKYMCRNYLSCRVFWVVVLRLMA